LGWHDVSFSLLAVDIKLNPSAKRRLHQSKAPGQSRGAVPELAGDGGAVDLPMFFLLCFNQECSLIFNG
jgi:hypothetical protein